MQFRYERSAIGIHGNRQLTLYWRRRDFDNLHLGVSKLVSEAESEGIQCSLGGGIRWQSDTRNNRQMSASAISVKFHERFRG